MPKRIRQHQLEDISRAKFKLALPEEWVVRDKSSDYGIDCEVEIFSEGRPTGLVFWVQLKATQATTKKSRQEVRMKIETLDYYKRLDIPVLLARYDYHNDNFFIRWSHGIDCYYARKKGSASVLTKFNTEDLLTERKSSDLTAYLQQVRQVRQGLRLPINAQIKIAGDSENRIYNQSSALLKSKIENEIHAFNKLLNFGATSEAFYSIEISKSEVKFHILDLYSCFFHGLENKKEEELPKSLAELALCSLAYCLIQVGQDDLAAEVIIDGKLEDILASYEQLRWPIISSMLSTSRFNDALKIVDRLSDESDDNFIECLTSMAVLAKSRRNDETKDAIQDFFVSRVARSVEREDKNLIGTAKYNLGNFYKGIGKYKLALKQYSQAAKYFSSYKTKSYFYRELGGILFELKRYKWSEASYSKAIDLDAEAETETLALLADAQMFAGSYTAASQTFNKYFEATLEIGSNFNIGEWKLKQVILDSFLENGQEDQQRQSIKSSKLAEVKEDESTEMRLDQLRKALDHDLLCGLAWFNLGITYSQIDKHSEAAFAFTACAVLQPWDVDAWRNATITSMSKSSGVPSGVLGLVLQTALHLHGQKYSLSVHQELASQSDPLLADKFIEEITSLIPPSDNRKSIEFRIHKPNGEFDLITKKV